MLEERLDFLVRGESHHAFDAGAVVPASVEDDNFPCGREMLDVPLNIHLGFLAFGRRWQGDDLENARTYAGGHALDRSAFASRIAALEHDANLCTGFFHPVLKLDHL